jgi:alginate O-acetyltransferase complex protein AlgI
VASGISRFLIGLSKKVLLANQLGELVSVFELAKEPSVLFYWTYAVAFSLQIYFDFSGYSDMAIGLGKILGFKFPENFDYPFTAQSITVFWRKWHMTLGSWFRDYVYFPLGGNRVTKVKWVRNIFIVWALTGLWHGAAWNFVIWGIYFGVLLILEKLWLKQLLDQAPRLFRYLYVILATSISFVLFDATNMAAVIQNLSGMFGVLDVPLLSAETVYQLQNYGMVLLIAAIGSTPLPARIVKRVPPVRLLEPVYVSALLVIVTAYLVDGSFNPFLYFRF